MALPKEPRQIMINIMYLVLTALLALNVSAEIFNAFRVVDKGLEDSITSLEDANAKLPAEIERLSRKKAELKVYADRAQPARNDAKEVSDQIDEIINHMIEETGGYLEDGKLKGEKNKDITSRYLVQEGTANNLKSKMTELHEKFMTYIDPADKETFESQIGLIIDTVSYQAQNTRNKSWDAFTFGHMPLQAVLPILHKYKNDVQTAENAVLNYLMGKVGGEDVVLDKFQVVAVPKKSYVIKGDPYEAEIFLSASAGGTSNTGLSISVNGSALKTDDGVGKYVVNTNDTGVKKYTAKINVTNPTTGEVKSYESLFEYEVGERSISVSADKMNVLYVGVDNPISVSAAGISSNAMKVSGSGAGLNISKTGSGKYNARVTSQGKATITVSGGGAPPTNFEYRTKYVPTPIPKLSTHEGGAISNGVFKAQAGVIPVLENFDFDLRCSIKGFTLVRIPGDGGDAKSVVNPGQSYNGSSQSLAGAAKPGDVYLFQNIQCDCPGWPSPKKLPELTFNIK